MCFCKITFFIFSCFFLDYIVFPLNFTLWPFVASAFASLVVPFLFPPTPSLHRGLHISTFNQLENDKQSVGDGTVISMSLLEVKEQKLPWLFAPFLCQTLSLSLNMNIVLLLVIGPREMNYSHMSLSVQICIRRHFQVKWHDRKWRC